MELNRMRNAVALVMLYVQDDFVEDETKWEKVTVDIEEYRLFSDYAFRLHFRLTKPVFMILIRELEDLLIQNGTILRQNTPFDHILMMVLWIMATPDSFRSVALRFGVHPSQLHTRYLFVIRGLCLLGVNYITWPTQEERTLIKRNILRRTGFPGVVGIMDGKHFSITRPIEDHLAHRNYHHGYSMKAQAVCDDKLLVRDLYVGEAGSLHDSRVYRRSPLCTNVLYNREMFRGEEHIIADSAYPLQERIMCPFRNNGHLTPLQRNFNRRLSTGRVKIEHCFGHVSMLWRRDQHLHVRDLEYCTEHTTATFVLHNFKIIHGERLAPLVVEHGDDDVEDVDEPLPVGEVEQQPQNDDDEPYVPHGNAARLLAEAEQLGEQKRWNICNELPPPVRNNVQ